MSTFMISEDDCFGKEWESVNKTCLKCSEYNFCMVKTLERTPPKRKYLDELDWELVPWADLLEMLQTDNLNFDELVETVIELSKCPDKRTAQIKVTNWAIDNGIKLKDGYLSIRTV